MALPPITSVTGQAVPVPGADIDTDRIIPARFMKCVTFDDLAEGMFYDVRFDTGTGEKTDHPLNSPKHAGASIMISGANFGCGSSREHAPQSIYRNGFRAIIAESFAEIFFGNSTTLGMPCVCASHEDVETLLAHVSENPDTELTIDLESMKVRCGELELALTMPESARTALASAKYDPLQELLDNEESIDKTVAAVGYIK